MINIPRFLYHNVASFNVNNGIPVDNNFWLYLNNIVLSCPEDGRLTAETCRQV